MILPMKDLISRPMFLQWIQDNLAGGTNVLARSNQGTILLYRAEGVELVVKCAMGNALAHRFRQRTLIREFEAYRKMSGLQGIPACHGLVDGRFLVLDFVRGKPFREAVWDDREGWFDALYRVIRSFHERGVSHGDLKSKSNILVTESQQPCVIDFGTAFIFRSGYHPVNNSLHRYGKRLDLNAWVKHKYHGSYKEASDRDKELLNYSWLERSVRRLRGRPFK
jgi:tRNA A-37 threonylcarbamoyl transferase component Bud32